MNQQVESVTRVSSIPTKIQLFLVTSVKYNSEEITIFPTSMIGGSLQFNTMLDEYGNLSGVGTPIKLDCYIYLGLLN